MAFNGSGVFVRLYNWVNDAAANIKIRADRMDAEMDGFATGLTTCITKNGQTTITANLPMAGFRHTGCGDAAADTDYLTQGQLKTGTYTLTNKTLTAPTLTAPVITGGATITGTVTINGAVSGSGVDAGGFRNRFRNGNMDVWQRGTSGTITAGSPALTADGWYVSSTGANVPWAQVAGRASTLYALKVTGAASVTNVLFKQRIEALIAAVLYPNATAQVTVQAKIYNNTGASITPTLTVKHADASNNFSAMTTDVNAVSLQACPNTTLTTVAYTFASASGTANGLEVTIDCGNNFGTSGKSVEISELDIRVTPNVTTGLNSSPPPIEFRHYPAEYTLCTRYYWTAGSIYVAALVSGTIAVTGISYPTEMISAPTINGGGAGFTGVATTKNATYFYQTTTNAQSLTFTAEL